MRRRTGVKRSTLGAATQPISPQESLPSMASRSCTHTVNTHTILFMFMAIHMYEFKNDKEMLSTTAMIKADN